MTLSRSVAVIVGILTLWPVLFVVLCIAGFAAMFAQAAMAGDAAGDPMAAVIIPMVIAGGLITGLIGLGLLVFYVVHIVKNPALTTDMQVVWCLLVFVIGFIAMPVYWFLYVWPQSVPRPAVQS